MTSALKTVISDVEAAIAGGGTDRRREMLRKMADLFAGEAARLTNAQVAAFDTVIMQLVRDMETEARAELSERLADIANAPNLVIRHLAFDPAAAVAGPVLERSSRLSEDDLVHVAERRGQGHLMAITRRPVLTKRVTDVIVTRGDQAVLRSVAGNDGAQFSERGHTTLVGRAGADPLLLAALQRRVDIPPSYRKRLVALAKQQAERVLSAEFGPGAQEAVLEAVTKTASSMKASPRDEKVVAAEAAVASQARTSDLDETVIGDWLKAGKQAEALVALARLAGVPSQMAFEAYEAENYEPLLFLVRSVNFGWRILKQFMTAKAGSAPAPELMHGAMEAFQALSVATAQRVVRFTATREYAQRADAGAA